MELAGQDDRSIGLRQYLDVIRRQRLVVVAIFGISIGAAAVFSAAQTPVYRAETKIVVGQGNSLFQPTFANAVQPFTATMSDLVTSNVVASRVIHQLGLNESPEQLLQKVSVSINPQTAVLGISVDDHSAQQARRIADALGVTFSQLVKQRFGNRPVKIGPSGSLLDAPLTATIWDPAHVDPNKVAPKPKRNIAIAAALGLVLALLGAFLREHFDRRLRTREEVEDALGVPVIGQIPFEGVTAGRQRHPFGAPSDAPSRFERIPSPPTSESSEAFRALRANLNYLSVERPLRTILVTSASPQQGKTTVTANLAVAIARSGATTIAVEADLRRPRLEQAFHVRSDTPGLTSVLVGSARADAALLDASAGDLADVQGAERVMLLSSGPLPPNPSELLSSPQMRKLLDDLISRFDYVLIDSPPLLAVADTLELARIVDGVILVARKDRTNRDEAAEVRSLVERLDINLVGVVFTGVPAFGSYGGYGYTAQKKTDGQAATIDKLRSAARRSSRIAKQLPKRPKTTRQRKTAKR
ncbi:MAG: polysaccharide biosynthesis tyrosine autokinase [Gaiellaceae bacterium]